MAGWQDKVLNARTPQATAAVFRSKKQAKDVMTKKELPTNPPGTMKRAYKGRPA